jgi:peptidoglycan/LPS O-acetylase OafA/YrhL
MRRVDLLDVARFLAAISVVCFHYGFNGIANGKISSLTHVDWVTEIVRYGYLGVEFFLMISGYVIIFSSKNRSAADFASARALRLFPAFWVAVVLTSGMALVWGVGPMAVTPAQIVANLSMIAPVLGYDYVDGVYWTLMLELSFYALVLAFLFFHAERWLEPFLLIWPALIFLCATLLNWKLPFLSGYYSYFAAGAVLAVMKNRRGVVVSLALFVSLLNCLMFSARRGLRAMEGYEFSPLVVAAAVLGFFAFFLFLNTRAGERIEIPRARLLGSMTYPLYLIHAHIGYMLMSHLANNQNKFWVVPLILLLVLTLAYVLHVLVENKLHHFWRRLFQHAIGGPVRWLQAKLPVPAAS